MRPTVKRLDNGLTIVLVESHAAPVVAFQMWVGVGSADERKGEEGLAHVFEHMLFKGTKRRSVGEIPQDVERAGGHINAWTSHDETVFHITLASRYAEQGLDILADAVQHAALDPAELKSELEVIREEIRMGEDSPDRMVMQDLFSAAFRRHPYGRPVIGYDRTVKHFDRRAVAEFYRRWYVGANMVFVVCGDFDEAEMLSLIDRAFAQVRRGKVPVRSTRCVEPAQRNARVVHRLRPISEAHLAIGFPIAGLSHEDTAALDLLAAVLGQGMSSRLEVGVRRRLGLVSDIRAAAFTPVDAGLLCVVALLPPHNVEKASCAIADELFRLTREPLSRGEIEKARTLIESDTVFLEETVDGLARKLGFFQLHNGDVGFERRYLGILAQLDAREVLVVANRYLRPERVVISTVVPDPARRQPRGKVPWITGRGRERILDGAMLRRRLGATIDDAFVRSGAERRVAKRSQSRSIIYALSNGDTLLVRPDQSGGVVASRAAFFGGLRQEQPNEAGLGALLANCLTRGTEARSAEEVSAVLDQLACSVAGFSGRNTVGITGEFLARNYATGFQLMAECLCRPAFPTDQVAREQELLLEELHAGLDNPSYQLFKIFCRALFGDYPYGRPVIGTAETVAKLGPAELRRALLAATGKGKMVLSVVGDVDPDEALALAETCFASRTGKDSGLRDCGSWQTPTQPRQVTLDLPKEQSHVLLGFPGTSLDAADRFAVEVLVEILGGHGGRLFGGVRESLGLAYAVTATSMEGLEPGYIALYAATSPCNERRVLEALLAEVHKLRRERPDASELERVKRHLAGSRAIGLQRASSRAASIALDHLYGIGYDSFLCYPKQIEAVKANDVVRVARQYLVPEQRIVACVGPNASKLNLL